MPHLVEGSDADETMLLEDPLPVSVSVPPAPVSVMHGDVPLASPLLTSEIIHRVENPIMADLGEVPQMPDLDSILNPHQSYRSKEKNMPRTDADIEAFINDLDIDDIKTVIGLILSFDPVAMDENDRPRHTVEEISLISLFEQFDKDHPIKVEEPEFDVETGDDGCEVEHLTDVDESGLEPETL